MNWNSETFHPTPSLLKHSELSGLNSLAWTLWPDFPGPTSEFYDSGQSSSLNRPIRKDQQIRNSIQRQWKEEQGESVKLQISQTMSGVQLKLTRRNRTIRNQPNSRQRKPDGTWAQHTNPAQIQMHLSGAAAVSQGLYSHFILTLFPLSSALCVVRAMLAEIPEGFSGSYLLAMVIVLAVGQGKSCSISKPHERGSWKDDPGIANISPAQPGGQGWPGSTDGERSRKAKRILVRDERKSRAIVHDSL